ncbi:MAG: uncharacterized membrane protein YhaH (DUF805 family) [Acidimicrobiales bacterium]|jgi:uncharacterized membrane protein YhaH (DUF805 family)
MKRKGKAATIIGIVCGAELVVIAIVGGAGLGSLLGWKSALFAVLALVPLAAVVVRRRLHAG